MTKEQVKQIRKPVYVVVKKFFELGQYMEVPVSMSDSYEEAEHFCMYLGDGNNLEICKRWCFMDNTAKYETANGESLMD